MISCSPFFIPAGSYQDSSNNLQVTLSAICINLAGRPVPASLTYNESQAEGSMEIANLNGVLTLVSGSGDPDNANNSFLPAGSYPNSSSISVVLMASCQKVADTSVSASLDLDENQAAEMTDIANENGLLVSVF